ncbi:pyruvate kinase [Duganella sp. FT92W]|uniref:Pyruvate kinase n=1 Tax=Pseudoduganella rivuli TaxID=2666085 RepID=A0A7X2LV97_9BURK|nr:pyruvate kinase [Pseudoduganella rivuli]MRV73847.1 pyruvate kinase [Pseudoduganella rivuli]
MRRERKAKIVATLGPASAERAVIQALFEEGADVFRFNFSHGSHADHQARHDIVRAIEKDLGRPIAILADLQGPKLRIGQFAGGKVTLQAGAVFTLDRNPEPGNENRVCLPHPELFEAVRAGQALLIDDGRVRLKVTDSGDDFIRTQVVNTGVLSDRKGVNVPDAVLPIPALTEKDRRDLSFALELGVDWIALSFVQRPEDVIEAKELVKGRAGVLAKLEKPQALERLEEIIEQSDAVMVARGDLGVELPPERVPGVQKRIVRLCRKHGKPVVVATQMLESMVTAPVPTRAEASDVANAVYEGADAVMLSAESASGLYPVQAVAMMNRIISEVERDPLYPAMIDAQRDNSAPVNANKGDAISSALRDVTRIMGVTATVAYTTSGHSALRTSRERPLVPIVSITPSQETARRLALAWGVHSTVSTNVYTVDEMVAAACRTALAEGFVKPGDQVAIAAGTPFGQPGTTNLLRLAEIWPQ